MVLNLERLADRVQKRAFRALLRLFYVAPMLVLEPNLALWAQRFVGAMVSPRAFALAAGTPKGAEVGFPITRTRAREAPSAQLEAARYLLASQPSYGERPQPQQLSNIRRRGVPGRALWVSSTELALAGRRRRKCLERAIPRP